MKTRRNTKDLVGNVVIVIRLEKYDPKSGKMRIAKGNICRQVTWKKAKVSQAYRFLRNG